MTMPDSAILQKLAGIFQDPPPDLAFEIGPSTVAMARILGGAQSLVEELPPTPFRLRRSGTT